MRLVVDEIRFRQLHTVILSRGNPTFTFTPYFPYRPVDFRTMIEWCKEQFGDGDLISAMSKSSARWLADDHDSTVWFREETDATVFRLRWC